MTSKVLLSKYLEIISGEQRIVIYSIYNGKWAAVWNASVDEWHKYKRYRDCYIDRVEEELDGEILSIFIRRFK